MAIFLLMSPLGSFFLPPSHQGDRKIQEFLCSRVPSVDVRGWVPPTRGWMSLVCFSRPNIPRRKTCWEGCSGFFYCALGLYKILLIRYHSAFPAFIKGEEQKVNVYPSSECTCASTLPPRVLTAGYLQTLTLQVQEETC